MPRKKFIDKKNAVTFHLVHRSQKDPLQADEDAPKRVLLPAQDSDTRKEQEQKFGVFFDDGYNYLQHLKDTSELQNVEPTECFRLAPKPEPKPKSGHQINLPSTVFGTDYETDVGLLNKAAPLRGPQLDWDPDIVEALDDDFDFDNPDNHLDDDFFLKANDDMPCRDINETPDRGVASGYEAGADYASDEADMSGDDCDDNLSDVGSLGQHSFMSAETKTRFTNYSMSSSIMKRNDGLTLLDDRFEQMFQQYDDTEVGALDQEEIAGFIKDNDFLLNDALQAWEESSKVVLMKDAIQKAEEADVISGSESSDNEMMDVTETTKEDKWDCESILSTYSNIYNHPKKITEPSKKFKPIQLTKRIEIPDDVLPQRGLTLKQIEKEDRQQRQFNTVPTERPKNESAEEKKARKQAIKEQRRERRVEKKMNKQAFKDEEMRLHKEVVNLHKNMKSVKIL